jgi:hypothetical protein
VWLDAAGVAKCGIPCHVLQANRLRSKPSSHTTVTSRGDGEPRDTDCSGALTCRGRPHAQVDWLVAKSRVRGGVRGPQSCLHTCGAMPARRGRLETKGVARDGATAHKRPLQKISRLDGRLTHKILARRRRAQGHEWTRSTTLSRGGSPAARWPALRQVHMAAHLDAAGASRKRPRWRRGKDGCGGAHIGSAV